MAGDVEMEKPIHTMPLFGPKHSCSADCWCHPEIVNRDEVLRGEHLAYLYMHNVAH